MGNTNSDPINQQFLRNFERIFHFIKNENHSSFGDIKIYKAGNNDVYIMEKIFWSHNENLM